MGPGSGDWTGFGGSFLILEEPLPRQWDKVAEIELYRFEIRRMLATYHILLNSVETGSEIPATRKFLKII